MRSLLITHKWLVLIVLITTGLHFFKLGEVPKILNPDEASIAYNAVLLKETGKDEWGKQWPLVLDAFGDQKLIGYPALVVGSFQLFGYADWVVKLPSLIAGSALIVLAYILTLQLGKKKSEALLAASLIATVPVFFFYSRVAFEAMVTLAYLLSGLSLLFQSRLLTTSKNKILLELFASLLFLLALLTYNSPVLLVPIIIATFILSQNIVHWQRWIRPIIVISAIWLCFFAYFWPLTQQKSKITLFGDETTLQQFGEYRAQFHGIASSILGNKYLFYGQLMAQNYAKSWSPAFLLYNVGGHPWHTMVGYGYLNWTIYIFGLIGIFSALFMAVREIIYKKKGNLTQLAVLFLFFTSLLPSIITVNSPQATRSLLFFFLWCLFAASGLLLTSNWLSKKAHNPKLNITLLALFCALLLIEVFQYQYFYFNVYGRSNQLQGMFEPGFDKALQKVNEESSGPLAIVDQRGFNYILLAWYLKMTPAQFSSTVKKQLPDKINFKYGEQVGRFHFIGKVLDRRTDEKTVLEWDASKSEWLIHQF